MITFFREAMIFNNFMANQLCDELIGSIAPEDNAFPHTAKLSGAVAHILQTGEEGMEIHNILFKIRGDEAYFRLLQYLDQIPTVGMEKYANRTYFRYKAGAMEICIMIAFESPENEDPVVDYNGIRLEDKNFINPEWL